MAATISGCVYDPPMPGAPFLAVLMTEGRVLEAGAARCEDDAYDLLVELLTEHAERARPESRVIGLDPIGSRGRRASR